LIDNAFEIGRKELLDSFIVVVFCAREIFSLEVVDASSAGFILVLNLRLNFIHEKVIFAINYLNNK
jgi:hypothetical protein